MISSCSDDKFKSHFDKLLMNIADLPCQPVYNNSLDWSLDWRLPKWRLLRGCPLDATEQDQVLNASHSD